MSSATILYLLSVLLFSSSAALIMLARRSAWIRRVFGADRMVEDVLETDFFDDSGEFTRPLSRVSGIVALSPSRSSSGFERIDEPVADSERRTTTARLDLLSNARTTGVHASVGGSPPLGVVRISTVTSTANNEHAPAERFDALAVRDGTGIRATLPARVSLKASAPGPTDCAVGDDMDPKHDEGEKSVPDGREIPAPATRD